MRRQNTDIPYCNTITSFGVIHKPCGQWKWLSREGLSNILSKKSVENTLKIPSKNWSKKSVKNLPKYLSQNLPKNLSKSPKTDHMVYG